MFHIDSDSFLTRPVLTTDLIYSNKLIGVHEPYEAILSKLKRLDPVNAVSFHLTSYYFMEPYLSLIFPGEL